MLQSAPIRSVLFVCHGNVCRSPFAASLFADVARRAALAINVGSAGFVGPGRKPPEPALRASQRKHIDLSGHVSALVERQSVSTADVVCVMEASQETILRRRFGRHGINVVVLGDLDPQAALREGRTIVDPWGCGDDVFDASYERIERCVRELLQLVAASTSPTRSQA